MRKRVIITLIFLSLSITLSGCGFFLPFFKSDPNYKTPDEQTKEYSENLIKIFMDKDEVALKKLLCKDILDTHEDVDDEVYEILCFIEGDIVSYDPLRSGAIGGTTTAEEGAIEETANCEITNICTSEGKSYDIYYSYGMINKDNPEHLGISYIHVINNKAKYDEEIGSYHDEDHYEIIAGAYEDDDFKSASDRVAWDVSVVIEDEYYMIGRDLTFTDAGIEIESFCYDATSVDGEIVSVNSILVPLGSDVRIINKDRTVINTTCTVDDSKEKIFIHFDDERYTDRISQIYINGVPILY